MDGLAQNSRPLWLRWCAPALLLAAVFGAFENTLRGPFVFDDTAAILENETIRHFATAFSPPADRGLPVTSRPLLNASFALNYALGGLGPRGYHYGNLALHGCAALLLFGLVRRTLSRPNVPASLRDAAAPLAWSTAFLWAMHPLTTAAVSYVSQRAEVLMACFYLLTLYAFARSLDQRHALIWRTGAVLACWCGMATKEVTVSAPLIVLVYDRTFGTGSFTGAWRERRAFYALLALSWLLLGWLMLHADGRAGTAGFGLAISPFGYALKQGEALVHYLRLAAWPAPLVFDYGGTRLVAHVATVVPQATFILLLLGGTVWALVRRPMLGFIGSIFFAILAPTSSFVPVADTMFEHRMYLPLAAVIATFVCVAYLVAPRRAWLTGLLLLPLALTTIRRNQDYRSEIALWSDTIAKQPDNVRAHYTLGTAFAARGEVDRAIAEYHAALKLNPHSAETHNDLANALVRHGDLAEAVAHYEAALRIAPSAQTHNNLANLLVRVRQFDGARQHYEAALQLRPNFVDAYNNFGNLLAQQGKLAEASAHYEIALRLRPDLVDAQANLGNVLAQSGKLAEAIEHYEAALQGRPDFTDAHFNLATTLMQLHRWPEAIVHYEAVLRLKPNYPGGKAALDRAHMIAEMFGDRKP